VSPDGVVGPDGVVSPDGVVLRDFDGGGGPGPRSGGLPASPALPFIDPVGGDPVSGDPADRFTNGPTGQSAPGGPPVMQVAPNAVAFAGMDGSPPLAETGGGDRPGLPDPSTDPSTLMLPTGAQAPGQPAPSTDPHDVPMTPPASAASAAGSGRGPVEQVAPDGTVFANFDASGRPTQGRAPDGTPFTLTYDDKGDVIEHFSDGSSVTYNPQGQPLSMVSPNGESVTFAVDIPALNIAANAVSGRHGEMSATIDSLKQLFVKIEGEWKGPAGNSFTAMTTTFNTVTDKLSGLLGEAVGRMRSSYHNYVSTEQTNSNNLH
jgi:YD repeat-containing protein